MERLWLKSYPAGVPPTIDDTLYGSLIDLIDEAFRKHAARTAYIGFGVGMTFGELDARSRAFAAWLQSTGLRRGDLVVAAAEQEVPDPAALQEPDEHPGPHQRDDECDTIGDTVVPFDDRSVVVDVHSEMGTDA